MVLFEALSRLAEGDDVPRTADALLAFVEGPLSDVLREKHSPEEASAVLENVREALSSASIDSGSPSPIDEASPPDAPIWVDIAVEGADDLQLDPAVQTRATLKVATAVVSGDTLRLMIVSQKARLARWIGAAFGGERVTVTVSARLEECRERMSVFNPKIIVIDGQDTADIRPLDLADLLDGTDEERLVIIWASDQPGGSAASAGFQSRGAAFTEVPRDAGFEPMLDYIRARIA